MNRADVQALLKDFGAAIGLNDLALDDSGRLALSIDDRLTVDVQHAADGSDLLLSVDLQALGAQPDAGALIALLDANLDFADTRGGAFAIDGPDHVVVLQRRVALRGLRVPDLVALLEGFLATAEAWAERLAAGAGTIEAPAETAGVEAPLTMLKV